MYTTAATHNQGRRIPHDDVLYLESLHGGSRWIGLNHARHQELSGGLGHGLGGGDETLLAGATVHGRVGRLTQSVGGGCYSLGLAAHTHTREPDRERNLLG